MSINFIFPKNREQFEYIEGVQHLRKELQKEDDISVLWSNKFRSELRDHRRYIYAKCRYCTACLRYKYVPDEERYQLKVFNNQHTHSYSENLTKELQRFVNDLPISIELATVRKIAMSRFKISASKFYHNYAK